MDLMLTSSWDGRLLLDAFAAATNLIIANQRQLNALNVYPYPDGDTGANMALTMRAALDEAEKRTANEQRSAALVCASIERGSLMGARGNSGVILSQFLKGFARSVDGLAELDGKAFAAALAGGRDAAYAAVMEPVEGTMLTVIRVAAEHATRTSAKNSPLLAVVSSALAGAQEALADTPNLLAILREAGVVDAGGQGIVHLLDGFDRAARGERVSELELEETDDVAGAMSFLDHIAEEHADDEFGYCTNFMVFGSGIPFDRLRGELAEMGRSAVIVGDQSIVKVHIHTDDPGRLLMHALKFGELGQIKIDNMNSQLDSLVERRAAAATVVLPPAPTCGDVAVVAVAPGPGIEDAFRSMGACAIVKGGQTMNPSVEQLLDAIMSAPVDDVILLPNNANILLAAEQAASLAAKRVTVVRSRSVPQGLAALEAFNDHLPVSHVVASMADAISSVRTIEITTAERDATADGVTVKQGEFIGVLDDRLLVAGPDAVAVAIDAIKQAGGIDAELLTVFVGAGGPAADLDPIGAELGIRFPEAEIQVYDGGQPHDRYIIAVE
jgi:hypothetical protein